MAVFVGLVSVSAQAADDFAAPDPRLQTLVEEASAAALTQFKARQLQPEQLAITLVDLRDAGQWKRASFRGGVAIYPASVVKLFYLAAAHRWMEDGKIADTAELRRAMRDMIVDSSNDATHYVIDLVSGTTGGPELPAAEMKLWGEKRNVFNRHFRTLGYTNINVNQKPWGDGPYGRERIWVGEKYDNRNALTTEATARLLTEMAVGRCVTAARSAEMMKLQARDPWSPATDPEDQAHGFTGLGLPRGAKLWSKAGWTSTARHDAAYVELPDGRKFVLVIFTTGHATERQIIPFIVRQVVAKL